MSDQAVVLPGPGRGRRAGDGAPAIHRVAEALIDGEPIHWAGVDSHVRSAHERDLAASLRAIAGLAGAGRIRGADAERLPRDPFTTLDHALVLASAVLVVAALVVLTLSWSVDRTTALPLALRGGVVLAWASAGSVLLWRAPRVRHARALGEVCLLVAVLVARPLLSLPTAHRAPWLLRAAWDVVVVEACLPIALWRFVRQCPLVVRFTPFDLLSRGVLVAAALWSLLLASASAGAALRVSWPAGTLGHWWLTWQRQDPHGPFWTVLAVWVGLSLLTMAWRARQAAPREARRASELLMWVAPALASLTIGALGGGAVQVLDPRGASASVSALAAVSMAVALPWLATLAVLRQHDGVTRRPAWRDVASILSLGFGLALGLTLVVSAAYLYTLSDRPLQAVLADAQMRRVLLADGVAAALLLGAVGWQARHAMRRQLRGGDIADVAGVAAAVALGRTPREMAQALVRLVQQCLPSAPVAVLLPADGAWTPMAGVPVQVPRDSAIEALLEGGDGPMRVHDGSRLFDLLPVAERAWVTSQGLDVVARLAEPGGQTVGGLLLHRRRDGGPYTRRELAWLGAALRTAALAMHARLVQDSIARGSSRTAPDDDLSYECEACGEVADGDASCACGGRRVLAALPRRFGEKFTLERRLGRGGMGVVYLALDTRLDRRVALKTLPCLQPGAATAMHGEARAMAAVEHPSVALLYDLEVWRETPVLVVEYLPGGTLAARLAGGPLPPREAVGIGLVLADALAELHRRGWLHRDIKPSNIAFGRNGDPKLLDFGLTRLYASLQTPDADVMEAHVPRDAGATGSVVLAGTPMYLSPEALDGRPVAADADVWALSVVLFEMVAGTHPFRGTVLDEVRDRVRRAGPLDVRAWTPDVPVALAVLLRQALHPQVSHRITSAVELSAALRVVASQC